MIAIDFETYYSSTHKIQTFGPWGYAHHPDTDIYMVSIVGEGFSWVGDPKNFDWTQLNGRDLVSHNAAFDMIVTHAAMERGIISPEFSYNSWSCSADLMAYIGYPRALADAYQKSFGVEVSKKMRNWMSGKRWSDAVAKGKDKELEEYALNDSVFCLALWEKHEHQWPQFERQVSAHNRHLLWRGVNVDQPKLHAGISHLEGLRGAAEQNIPWRHDAKILSLPALRRYCADIGIEAPASMAKDSEECLEWEEKYGASLPFVAAVRDYRRTNMLLSKLMNIDARIRADGTMPVALKYWGAHTGRWSGDSGVNLQNLPRGEMFGVNLREMFIPRDGNKFIISDLSQVEPRVMAWVTNDQPFMDRLSGGGSLYEAYARGTLGWTGGKLKVENPELYLYTKASILGLGYGCGVDKFLVVAKALAGLELTREQAAEIVTTWRGQNSLITRFWRTLDQQLAHAKNHKKDLLEFPLPSGRTVKWWQPRPHYENTNDTVVHQSNGQKMTFTWGGKMTENVVQALSRDIFADQMMRAEAASIPVTWSVHDELVCEAAEDQAEDALAELNQIMSTPPEWIPDIPLAAEGGVHSCYTK